MVHHAVCAALEPTLERYAIFDSYACRPNKGGYAAIKRAENRVNRGGSWNNDARNCRSAYRNNAHPGNRNNNLGFRVSSSLQSGQKAGVQGLRPSARVLTNLSKPASLPLSERMRPKIPGPARVGRCAERRGRRLGWGHFAFKN